MIKRNLESQIKNYAAQYPVLSIVGPRQSGKTTLVRYLFSDYRYVSLENLDTRNLAQDDPRGFLHDYPPPVIIDEIQRVPHLTKGLIIFNGESIIGSQSSIPAVPWWQL